MNRREMIDELLERLEGELDELNNAQLEFLNSEYEHSQLLGGLIESLNQIDDSEEEDADIDDEELSLVDENWDDEAEE